MQALIGSGYLSFLFTGFPRLPSSVAEELTKEVKKCGNGSSEYVISCSPHVLYQEYHKLTKRLGMNYRFHDLRLFFASSLHALGIPDVYIMREGGWKSPTVLNEVYKQVMADAQVEFQDRAEEYFSKINSVANSWQMDVKNDSKNGKIYLFSEVQNTTQKRIK